jgi:hypothetical protein
MQLGSPWCHALKFGMERTHFASLTIFSPPFFTICHDRQCFPRCSSSPTHTLRPWEFPTFFAPWLPLRRRVDLGGRLVNLERNVTRLKTFSVIGPARELKGVGSAATSGTASTPSLRLKEEYVDPGRVGIASCASPPLPSNWPANSEQSTRPWT